MPDVIRFISDRSEYGWLSNFEYTPFTYDGRRWDTVEHAFQAAKCYPNRTEMERIRRVASPGEAKKLGNKVQLRKDWEHVKVSIMEKLVHAKFTQYLELTEKLLATGTSPIEEDAPWDSFWGTGRDGNGQNMMGKILMRLRKELRENR